MADTFTLYMAEFGGPDTWCRTSQELIATKTIINVITVIGSDGTIRVLVNYYGPPITPEILRTWWPQGTPYFVCMGGRFVPVTEAPTLPAQAANDENG